MTPSQLIRRYGWVQGDYGGKDCGYCIVGALTEGGVGSMDFAYTIADKIGGMHIVDWNDAPGRTVNEVLALLEGEGL
jgi:hypothetical protein